MITDVGFFAAGLAAGTVYFTLLRWNTMLYVGVGRLWTAAAAQIARFLALAGLFTIAALHGGLPLLLTALGVLVARPCVIRWQAPAS